MEKSIYNKQIYYLVAAIVWMGIIFYLSSIPDLASGLPSWQDLILRKIAHVLEYFILTYLLAKSLNSRHGLWLAVIVSIIYAVADEWHQGYVPGREMAIRDILFDSSGVVLAGIFLYKKIPLR